MRYGAYSLLPLNPVETIDQYLEEKAKEARIKNKYGSYNFPETESDRKKSYDAIYQEVQELLVPYKSKWDTTYNIYHLDKIRDALNQYSNKVWSDYRLRFEMAKGQKLCWGSRQEPYKLRFYNDTHEIIINISLE